ncbi:MAG: molybdopterin-guanine dinucleotide biosynthesis protein A [Alphaproteobacteria bacterium]
MCRVLCAALAVWVFPAMQAGAQDRHDGYYYPTPKSEETYTARSRILPGSDRDRRLGFVVGFTRELASDPAPQRYAIFAKGADGEKLIVVALDDDVFATLFRARAILATLTSRVRASPLFAELGVQNLFTFYDLAKLLGFTQITVSDGREWSHRINLK